ncbi:hypothetical protein ACFV0L_04210 [Streptosporangium canum]
MSHDHADAEERFRRLHAEHDRGRRHGGRYYSRLYPLSGGEGDSPCLA